MPTATASPLPASRSVTSTRGGATAGRGFTTFCSNMTSKETVQRVAAGSALAVVLLLSFIYGFMNWTDVFATIGKLVAGLFTAFVALVAVAGVFFIVYPQKSTKVQP